MSRDAAVAKFDGVKSIGETMDALKVVIDGWEHWIPKSQIHDDSEVWTKDQEGELVVTEWIAKQKGLI
jgi:hypothetical protein